jgi:hypothetical protein
MSDSESSTSDEDDDASVLRVHDAFDGIVARLPRSRVLAGSFIPPQSLVCASGERLYVGVLEQAISGGRRRNGVPSREHLCFYYLPDGRLDFYGAQVFGRDHWLPVRLYWLTTNGILRRAIVRRRGDAMESLTFSAYRPDGKRVEPLLHRVMAFTFCCPPRVWTQVFSSTGSAQMDGCDVLASEQTSLYDVNHVDETHGNNSLGNLELLVRDGPSGHRSLSGSIAKRTKR